MVCTGIAIRDCALGDVVSLFARALWGLSHSHWDLMFCAGLDLCFSIVAFGDDGNPMTEMLHERICPFFSLSI